MMNTKQNRKGLYRSRRGMILGVCRGVAEYMDLSILWIRVAAVLALIFTGFWPIGALYLLAALVMKPEPVLPLRTDEEQDFYDTYTNSRSLALQRLRRTFDRLERRIRRMEDIITTREYDWERRLKP